MAERESTFKERFKSLMNETTLHGVKHTIKKCSIGLRILWGLAFIACASYLTFGVVTLSREYSRKPVATKTYLMQKNNLQFPTVTLCNKNSFRSDIVEKYSVQYNTNVLKELLSGAFSVHPHKRNRLSLNWTDPKYEPFLNGSFPWEQFFKDSAHTFYDSLVSCKWHKKTVNCSNYFETKLTSIGYCFVFNANGSFHSYIGGTSGGLTITLDSEAYKYYFGRKSYSAGFQVLLHLPEEEPLVDELGFFVSPGTDKFVSMLKVEAQHLPYPAENSYCEDLSRSEFVNPLTYYKEYSQTGCLIECKTKFVLKLCGCKDIFQPGDGPICNFQQLAECVDPALDLFPQASEGLSACECPVSCHQVQYKYQLSQNLFPSDMWLLSFDIPLAVIPFLKENALVLTIYYAKLNHNFITEVYDYTFPRLVANLGGCLGLCVGASLLTVAESLEFGWMEIYHFIKAYSCFKKKNTVNTVN